MRNGLPFDTEDRDVLRARHRRLLLTIHHRHHRLASAPRPTVQDLSEFERGLMEDHVRTLIEDALQRDTALAELAMAISSHYERSLIRQFWNALDVDPFDDPLSDLAHEHTQSLEQGPTIPNELMHPFAALVQLLVYAEDLAASGFELERPREAN